MKMFQFTRRTAKPNRVSQFVRTIAAAAISTVLMVACSVPIALQSPLSGAPAPRSLTGPNGSVDVTGMTNGSLTVSYVPSQSITSAKLYLTEGNGAGLVLAAADMTLTNGKYTYTFSHPTFVTGAQIGLDVLINKNGIETNVPQGTLGNSGSWIHFTYGSDPNVFTVTFDSMGATTPATPGSKTVTKPATTIDALPTAPAKSGYEFLGWFTSPEAGNAFTASTTVSSDLTVYAHWKYLGGSGLQLDGPNGTIFVKDMINSSVTISYTPSASIQSARLFLSQGNGIGLVLASQTMTNVGGTYSWTFSHPTFTLNAKIYVDVLVNSTTGEKSVPKGTLSDTTSWASFLYGETPKLTVSFDSQGADVPASPSSVQVNSGQSVNPLPTNPSKTNSLFGGWFTSPNGSGTAFTATTVVTANLTVYAYWTTSKTVSVTFDSAGANVPANPSQISLLPGTVVNPLPVAPSRTGYSFRGWYSLPDGQGTAFTSSTVVNADTTVYASWNRSDVTLIDLKPGMTSTLQFANNTNGRWRDDQIYITVTCRDDRLSFGSDPNRTHGPLGHLKPDGTFIAANISQNTLAKVVKIPGKGDTTRMCTDWSFKLTDLYALGGNGGFQLPSYMDSARVYISYGEPMYLQVTISGDKDDAPWGGFGIAGPDYGNDSDPNIQLYFDFFEFAQIPAAWAGGAIILNANTSSVDGFSIPLTMEMFKTTASGYESIGKLGMHETRDQILAAWQAESDPEFKDLVQTVFGIPYRICSPTKMPVTGFDKDGTHAGYFKDYINQIWALYTQSNPLKFTQQYNGVSYDVKGYSNGDAFVFEAKNGTNVQILPIQKATSWDVFRCDGAFQNGNTLLGAITARFSAALNRHVAEDVTKWEDPSQFYKASPANFYAAFLHRHSIDNKAYGFAYDDVAGQNPTLQLVGDQRGMVIGCYW